MRHHDELVRVEVAPAEMDRALERETVDELARRFRALGLTDVRVDPAGNVVGRRNGDGAGARATRESPVVVLAHLAIKSYDLVVAMTDGGPGTATWTPALFMQKFTFGRNEMAMGASSAIIMMMMIFSIIVPYLYSELRGGRRQ